MIKQFVINRLIAWSEAIGHHKRKQMLTSLRARGAAIQSDIHVGEGTLVVAHDHFRELSLGADISTRRFCNFEVFADASLIIHDHVFFNNNCSVYCMDRIEIGEHTIFGEGVRIYDHNHRYSTDVSGNISVELHAFTKGPVKIGKNCWIGSGVSILKNVEIGDNVIIGAHCLIHKSVPSNSIIRSKG